MSIKNCVFESGNQWSWHRRVNGDITAANHGFNSKRIAANQLVAHYASVLKEAYSLSSTYADPVMLKAYKKKIRLSIHYLDDADA